MEMCFKPHIELCISRARIGLRCVDVLRALMKRWPKRDATNGVKPDILDKGHRLSQGKKKLNRHFCPEAATIITAVNINEEP